MAAFGLVFSVVAGVADGGSARLAANRRASTNGARGSALPRPLPVSRGAAHYVAPNGSDGAAGTLRKPWRTVQHALDSLRPGETAFVRGGTYRENLSSDRAGTRTKTITIRSYPGERVVLRPDENDPSYPLKFTSGAAFVRVQGFVIEGAAIPNTVNVYVTGRARHVELSRCEIRRAAHGSGIYIDYTTSGVQVIANVVHHNNEPGRQHQGIYYEGSNGVIANNVVYGQTNGFGIQVRTDARTGPDRVIVTNNTVTGNSLGGIVVEHTAARTTIVNNIAAYNGGAGIRGYFSLEDHALDPAGIGNVVTNNLVFGNRGYGNLHNDVITSGPSAGRAILRIGRNLVADPRFVSARRKDFRLRRDSPALGRALAGYAPSRDRSGRLRSDRRSLDLGAYERP
jgi:parallel beta-helix repeat protein